MRVPPNRLHIAITCNDCGGPGSVAAVARHHAKELSHYCHVTLISDTLPKEKFKGVAYRKVTYHHFDYLHRFCHVPNECAFGMSVRQCVKKINKIKPIHLIMCHSHSLAVMAADYHKKRNGIRYAVITHGDIFDRPHGSYDSRLTAFYQAVTPRAYRNADIVLALSPYMASCACKGGAKSETVHIVPNGIEPSDIGIDHDLFIQKLPERSRKEALNLLFVGGLTQIKGVDVLVTACKILDEKGVEFKLQIIGEGPLENMLRKEISRYCLTSQIKILGSVKRKLLGNYYQASDIVCVPSLNDPLPTVVLEALISGTPVIASDVTGIPYMIKNDFNGILVPSSRPEAIANAVDRLYQNPAQLCTLAQNARSSLFPRFCWPQIGKQIYELVQKLFF